VHNLQSDFNLSWALVAKTGARTQDITEMLELAVSIKEVDIVITSLGVNDVTSLQRAAHWLSAQEKLHQYCFSKLGAKHIIVSGMPPMYKFPLLPQPLRWVMGSRAKQFDRLQAIAIGKCDNKSYEPLMFELDQRAMAIDGFHPGPLIYSALAESLSERITYIAKSRFF
jgi:lysophospholipase L1-like esterase